MSTRYQYILSADFPSGLDIQTFDTELKASSIGSIYLSTDKMTSRDDVDIVFNRPLETEEIAVLDETVANQTLGAALSLEASADVETATSAIWTEKVTLPATIQQAGKYRIGWSYEWQYDNINRSFQGRVQIDDTTHVMEHMEEPKDGAITEWLPSSGFGYAILGAGPVVIDLDYGVTNIADTAGIRRARLEVWRTG